MFSPEQWTVTTRQMSGKEIQIDTEENQTKGDGVLAEGKH